MEKGDGSQWEMNTSPTSSNGVVASSLEIRSGNLTKSVALWASSKHYRHTSLLCALYAYTIDLRYHHGQNAPAL